MNVLVALLLAAAPPASPPAVDEALFQHFARALPDSPVKATGPDPSEIALLARLNRGRERDVRAVLEADEACIAPVRQRAVETMMRSVAGALGPDKLRGMIAFYEGPDFAVFDRLGARRAKAEPLAPAENAELDRIVAAYPLQAFERAMRTSGETIWMDEAVASGFAKCAQARAEAMERARLRAY